MNATHVVLTLTLVTASLGSQAAELAAPEALAHPGDDDPPGAGDGSGPLPTAPACNLARDACDLPVVVDERGDVLEGNLVLAGDAALGFGGASVPRWHLNARGNGLNLAETGVADGRLYVAPGGNVGVGTDAPAARLDVRGGVRIAGDLACTGCAGGADIAAGGVGADALAAHQGSFHRRARLPDNAEVPAGGRATLFDLDAGRDTQLLPTRVLALMVLGAGTPSCLAVRVTLGFEDGLSSVVASASSEGQVALVAFQELADELTQPGVAGKAVTRVLAQVVNDCAQPFQFQRLPGQTLEATVQGFAFPRGGGGPLG